MKNLLRHDNLWYTVVGYPDDDTTDTTARTRRDKKALSKISLMVETSCVSHIMQAQTAKEAWDVLEKAYDDKGLNRRVRLMRTLFSMKLDNFHNMESYVNEILSISEQFAGIGKPVDDEYIGIIMLQGLPEEYEPKTMALEHSGVAFTSDLVKTKLLQDKGWSQSRSEESALLVKNKAKPKKPWSWKCKSQGHYKQNCSSPGPQSHVQHNGKHGSS